MDRQPTIEEMIKFQQDECEASINTEECNYLDFRQAILDSLKELAAIKSQPVEPECVKRMERDELTQEQIDTWGNCQRPASWTASPDRMGGQWYAPSPMIVDPTPADLLEGLPADILRQILARDRALERARELGLGEDDIKALKG